MTPSIRFTGTLVCALALPFSTGCELLDALYNQDVEISVPLESPPADMNATDQVEAVEDALCSDGSSYNCVVLRALDETDDGEVSDPPRLPDEFPVEITITNPETQEEATVNVEEWVADVGLTDDIDLAQAIPIDLSSQVNVEQPEALKSVTFKNVALNWQANSFTFDTVDLDLYLTPEFLPNAVDAPALIADGTVERIGTIPAQHAETSGESRITFVEGGEEAFTQALLGLKFTVVVALPENAQIGLNDGRASGTKRKPKGEATVSLKAELVYTVSAADVVNQVQETQH